MALRAALRGMLSRRCCRGEGAAAAPGACGDPADEGEKRKEAANCWCASAASFSVSIDVVVVSLSVGKKAPAALLLDTPRSAGAEGAAGDIALGDSERRVHSSDACSCVSSFLPSKRWRRATQRHPWNAAARE